MTPVRREQKRKWSDVIIESTEGGGQQNCNTGDRCLFPVFLFNKLQVTSVLECFIDVIIKITPLL